MIFDYKPKKNKVIGIILIMSVITLFAETEGTPFIPDTNSPTLIDNRMYIQGINKQRHLISYITEQLSTGRSDIRYRYVIFDYESNQQVEELNKSWISTQLYGEEGILDWNDEKYKIDAYKSLISDTIQKGNSTYGLIPFSCSESKIVCNSITLLSRERLSRWTENITYRIDFTVANKQYSYTEEKDNSDIIKDISIYKGFDADDYILLIQKNAYDYFEDDDYFGYIIRGIKE